MIKPKEKSNPYHLIVKGPMEKAVGSIVETYIYNPYFDKILRNILSIFLNYA